MSRSRSVDLRALRRRWRRVHDRLSRTRWLPALLVLVLALMPSAWLAPLDRGLYDLRLQALAPAAADAGVVLIDIDEQALARHGRWPWPRRELARLIGQATAAGAARLVALDLVLAEPDHSAGLAALERLARGEGPQPLDAALASGLREALPALRPALDDDGQLAAVLASRPVLLGFHLSNEAGAGRAGSLPSPWLATTVLADGGAALLDWQGHGGNLDRLAAAARLGGGHLNATIDADGSVRRLPLLVRYQAGVQPALAMAMARVLAATPPGAPPAPPAGAVLQIEPADGPLRALVLRGPGGLFRVPVDAQAQALVPYSRGSITRIPAAAVMDGSADPALLRDKLVLVGVSAPGLIDQRRTPVDGAMLGTLVHAELLAGILAQRVPVAPAWGPALDTLLLLAVGGLLLWALPRLSLWAGALLALGLTLAGLGWNLAAWHWLGWSLPLAALLLLVPLQLVQHLLGAYRRAAQGRTQLAQLFGQYVPPELVDEMAREPQRYANMRGRNAELTVMFADVSGFTALAQRMPPAELGAMMNLLFSHLTDEIRAHRGTLDKYIGDAVMAFWGAPLDDPDHAAHAVDAAQAMLARMPRIHAELAARGWPALQLNIGIHTGTMVVGDLGSRHRRAYTVMGDAVNLAARLQAFGSRYNLGLVLGDATYAALRGRPCLPLGPVAVRGRDAGLPAWQPLPEAVHADEAALQQAWTALRRSQRGGRPADALAQIDALERRWPALAAVWRWQRMLVQDSQPTGGSQAPY